MLRKDICILDRASEELSVMTGRQRIRCLLDMPESDSGRPLVIFSHGLMMHCEINPVREMAAYMVSQGFPTLRVDFRGNGKSDGTITEMTPETEISDLKTVVEYVRRNMPGRKIVLFGHSLGGVVSSLTAAYYSELYMTEPQANPIAGLVLLAAAGNIQDDCINGRIGFDRFDPQNIPDVLDVWGSQLGHDYFTTGAVLDIYPRSRANKMPCCILQGSCDGLVSEEYARKFLEAMPQAEYHLIERGDHIFHRGALQAAETACAFLRDKV